MTEIRLEIWRIHLFSQPQIIFFAPPGSRSGDNGPQTVHPRPAPVRSLLLTSKESHQLVKEHYSQSPFTNYLHPRPWFNYKLDTLYRFQGCLLGLRLSDDANLVENMIVYNSWPSPIPIGQYGYMRFSDLVAQMTGYYPSLRRLTFVPGAAHSLTNPHLVAKKWESYLGDIDFEFLSVDHRGKSPIRLGQRLKFWRYYYERSAHAILDQQAFKQSWRRRGMEEEPPQMPDVDLQVMIEKDYEEEFDRLVQVYLNGKKMV